MSLVESLANDKAELLINNLTEMMGVLFGNDWVEHLRRAWVHNSEDNELANLAAPIHYYNRPPPKY
jgi:hypothetical protein